MKNSKQILNEWPPKPLKIKVKHIRGHLELDWSRPSVFMPIGGRGSGKSTVLENISTQYAQKGPIIDTFSSWDNESLAWCRHSAAKILFIVGNNVDVISSWQTRPLSKLTLSDILSYDITLTCPAFFHPRSEFYKSINKICWDILPSRPSWKHPIFLMGREIASLLYSRIQVVKDTQRAKAEIIEFLRQSRHHGVAIGIDTIRYTGTDAELRGVVDYIFIKGTGIEGLPDHLRFVYSYFEHPKIIDMLQPQFAVIVSKKRPMALGWIEYPSWHKEEKDNIIKELGIRIVRGDIPEPADNRKKVTKEQHLEIIKLSQQRISQEEIGAIVKYTRAIVGREIRLHTKKMCRCYD